MPGERPVTQKLTPAMKREEIPLNVLLDRNISCFESIVEYLKDERKLTYHQIALLTNRDDRTIWTIYSRARKKRLTKEEQNSEVKKDFAKQKNSGKRNIRIPLNILSDRNASILETISVYLKDEKNIRYSKIADLTNRDDRTIWTAYHRAKKKKIDNSDGNYPIFS